MERLLGEFREEADDKLNSESSSRDLALNKIELAMAAARMDAENQMAQMQDSFHSEIKAVRSELSATHKELSSALAKAEKSQDKRADKMDSDKVNRKDLSGLFTDIANKLTPSKSKKSK